MTAQVITTVAGLIWVGDQQYGTAAFIAAHLTSPERRVTAERVRDWARRSRNPRDKLHGMLPGVQVPGARTGTTWYRMDHAAQVARVTARDDVR